MSCTRGSEDDQPLQTRTNFRHVRARGRATSRFFSLRSHELTNKSAMATQRVMWTENMEAATSVPVCNPLNMFLLLAMPASSNIKSKNYNRVITDPVCSSKFFRRDGGFIEMKRALCAVCIELCRNHHRKHNQQISLRESEDLHRIHYVT